MRGGTGGKEGRGIGKYSSGRRMPAGGISHAHGARADEGRAGDNHLAAGSSVVSALLLPHGESSSMPATPLVVIVLVPEYRGVIR